MQSNSVQDKVCIKWIHKQDKVCIKWIHKRCSGGRGDLSLVADGCRCKQCDGTLRESDIAGDLVVDGEIYGCVKSFCYLGNTLDGKYGADIAAIARIRNGWMKFREIFHF